MTGNTSNVSTVATSKPPAIATAIGPQKILGMSGNMPKIAAAAVSIIGRKRKTAESIIAS